MNCFFIIPLKVNINWCQRQKVLSVRQRSIVVRVFLLSPCIFRSVRMVYIAREFWFLNLTVVEASFYCMVSKMDNKENDLSAVTDRKQELELRCVETNRSYCGILLVYQNHWKYGI